MSVTPPQLPELTPPETLKTTVKPPVDSCAPWEFLAVKVTVEVFPEVIELELKVIVDRESEAAVLAATVTLGRVEETCAPPIVALIEEAVPEVEAVNVEV